MFYGIINGTLPSNLLKLEEGLKNFPTLGLHKGTWYSHCPVILLIYTKHRKKRWNHYSLLVLISLSNTRNENIKNSYTRQHCIKYARIRVFTDPQSPVQGQNLRFCPYTYGRIRVSENPYSCIFYVVNPLSVIFNFSSKIDKILFCFNQKISSTNIFQIQPTSYPQCIWRHFERQYILLVESNIERT